MDQVAESLERFAIGDDDDHGVDTTTLASSSMAASAAEPRTLPLPSTYHANSNITERKIDESASPPERPKKSALQAMLDAQEASSGGGGGGRAWRPQKQWTSRRRDDDDDDYRSFGGSGRVGWGETHHSQRRRQYHSREQPQPQHRDRFGTSDRFFRGGGGRGAGTGSASSSRYNNHSTRKNNNAWCDPKQRGNHPGPSYQPHGPSYEERRAQIERKAIKDSENDVPLDSCADDEYPTWVGPVDADTGTCTYYQDREKTYPFYTRERGARLLSTLVETNRELLELNRVRIEEEAQKQNAASAVSFSKDDSNSRCFPSADVLVRIGHGLYAEKPTLRTKGVTWSTEEYGHPGLQRMYLRMKSIQRFTETWSLLERSAGIGVFDDIFQRGTTGTAVRIASIGGGPGYELLATRLFFKEREPKIDLELICLDVCEAWRPYAELLGFRFVHYDINKGGADGNSSDHLLEALGLGRGELHFCIVSCVMIYVTNNRTLDMFHNLVHEDEVSGILLSERGETMRACSMMEDRGGAVIRLIDQTLGVDERQAVFCSKEFRDSQLRLRHGPKSRGQGEDLTFPNVPYEEHKHNRRQTASRRDRGSSWRDR